MKEYISEKQAFTEDLLIQDARGSEKLAKATDAPLSTTIDGYTFVIDGEGYGFRVRQFENWTPTWVRLSDWQQARLAAVPWIAERRSRAKAGQNPPLQPKPVPDANSADVKAQVPLSSPLHTTTVEPKVGQIWQDSCPFQTPRYLLVKAVGSTKVQCVTLRTGKTSTIRKDRFKPGSRGYKFVVDRSVLEEIGKQLHGVAKEV